ncbi:unnamed protein product [Prorocentrum cordatum]|uniref:Oxidation resistance protein 1 n=1 Tax=Prorocentrum cordatum TaxID=2364126 RepID=A0ABN9R301_9DINO|nr:unnamed protein product [Polarella glacialis]
MGNALESLNDITEHGNSWEAQRAALSAAKDVLGPTVPLFPQLVVQRPAGPRRTSRHSDDQEDRSAQQPQDPQPETPGSSSTAPPASAQACFHKPAQMVLDAGISAKDRAGRNQRALWTPLQQCASLRDAVLLTEARLAQLHPHLPLGVRFATCWKLIYCPRVHGVSLQTFYRQSQAWPGETLLLVEDTDGVVFGGFGSHTWTIQSRLHFGTSESFVFTFGGAAAPEPGGAACSEPARPPAELQVHPWAGGNQHFMFADSRGFGMGGGLGYAFWIGRDLLVGSSAASQRLALRGRSLRARTSWCGGWSVGPSTTMRLRSASTRTGRAARRCRGPRRRSWSASPRTLLLRRPTGPLRRRGGGPGGRRSCASRPPTRSASRPSREPTRGRPLSEGKSRRLPLELHRPQPPRARLPRAWKKAGRGWPGRRHGRGVSSQGLWAHGFPQQAVVRLCRGGVAVER